MKKIKDLALPIAILLGFIFHHHLAKLKGITPFIIFILLYITLCSIDLKKIKFSWLHLWVIGFQITLSMVFYLALRPFSSVLAQGALVIVLTPTAISAPVIAAMLGANLSTMLTSTLLSNLAIALISPLYFSWTGIHVDLPFFQSSWMVLSKVTPLIILPFILALLTQRFFPRAAKVIVKRKNLPFFIWAFGLTIVIGSTIEYIYKMDSSKNEILIYMALLSLFICALQFAFGRWIGKRYGDVVAGGQSLGQKNTVLSIWMAQTYLNPVSSVVPASYVLWQNLFNSYQLIQKSRKEKK